jgi:biotin operon repressor
MSKWNEDREQALYEAVGTDTSVAVSQEVVAKVAEELEVSTRSVSSKLRKLGFEVEKVAEKGKTFSDEEEADLVQFVQNNEGAYTYAEIAEKFAGGKYTPRQVQGKILSLELTTYVKKAPKPESTKTYTDAEEEKFLRLANAGAFLEDIAEALDRPLASVRGKALSLSRSHGISIPKQRNVQGADKVDPLEALGDISKLTVEEIAEKIGKTPRGVKTMITNRGLECANYKAKAKKSSEA